MGGIRDLSCKSGSSFGDKSGLPRNPTRTGENICDADPFNYDRGEDKREENSSDYLVSRSEIIAQKIMSLTGCKVKYSSLIVDLVESDTTDEEPA